MENMEREKDIPRERPGKASERKLPKGKRIKRKLSAKLAKFIQPREKQILEDSVSKLYINSEPVKIAGRISNYLKFWQLLTNDQVILDIVNGCKFDFIEPFQFSKRETVTNVKESEIIDREISDLLSKGVIEKTEHCNGEFISTIFLRPKPDGSRRVILNLKNLNSSIQYLHFKMESLNSALRVITENCFMGSIDLRHDYYLVNEDKSHRKYLRFIWQGTLYEYTCLANGISPAPRWFTKLLKPVFGTLRAKGFISVSYIDDSYLQGETYEECQQNIYETAKLFSDLGFILNKEKSILEPVQKNGFPGIRIEFSIHDN